MECIINQNCDFCGSKENPVQRFYEINMGSTFKINVDGLGFIEAGNKKYKCDKCFEKNK